MSASFDFEPNEHTAVYLPARASKVRKQLSDLTRASLFVVLPSAESLECKRVGCPERLCGPEASFC